MKQRAIILCALWLAGCASPPSTTSNTAPLEIGMSLEAASGALGAPLLPIDGSEVYFAKLPAGTPGFYEIDGVIYLQFRSGRLTGWSRDWHIGSSIWPL